MSACSLGARKPTSEADLRDPGSSHLDWLYRSFMMRNKVTSIKCVLIFQHHLWVIVTSILLYEGWQNIDEYCPLLFIYFFKRGIICAQCAKAAA